MKENITYWRGIDYVKGVLIILVFIGHIIPGSSWEIYPRYLIYSFHMPLFIGISGFLLNIGKLDIRILPLFKKYWKRMICPWLIAVTVFYVVLNVFNSNSFSFYSLVEAYFLPYFHFWYVT